MNEHEPGCPKRSIQTSEFACTCIVSVLEEKDRIINLLRKALIRADECDWGLWQSEAEEVRRILGNGVI